MAWNPSPRVADCRKIARKWGFNKVIIIALENDKGQATAVSYGKTKAMCADAERLSGVAFEAVFKAFDPSEGFDEWLDRERKLAQTRKEVTDE